MKMPTMHEMRVELAMILRINVQDLPPVFSHMKVLKRGINRELIELYPSADPVLLSDWLFRYTTRFDYLGRLIKGVHRHDLNGNDAELLTPQAKQFAKRRMRERNKALAQERARAEAAA